IHGQDFWDKRSLDQSMAVSENDFQQLEKLPHVTQVVPRLESFALVSYGNVTKVASLIGVDPSKEDSMTHLSSKIVSGQYLITASDGVLIAEGLAELMKVAVGDSIVVFGQGYQGVTAAALLPVSGIVKFNLPSLNKTFIYLSLNQAQWLFGAEERLTSVSLMLDNAVNIGTVIKAARQIFGSGYELMIWDEMMPELVQSIAADNAGGVIMMIILYVVIGFGIFATVMMMTAERQREFGVLIAVGMKKRILMIVTAIETLFVSFIGVIGGGLFSLPILYYYYLHPLKITGKAAEAFQAFGFEAIMPFSLKPEIFTEQISITLVIAICSALYPILFIRKLKAADALHG
ncbi:MAG: FtsX-like permease family protein, partial [Candidatus Neomarinimicrobiota bacterium]